jgi:hypothetical protein
MKLNCSILAYCVLFSDFIYKDKLYTIAAGKHPAYDVNILLPSAKIESKMGRF